MAWLYDLVIAMTNSSQHVFFTGDGVTMVDILAL
jgi:hypothetical protein